MSRVAGALGYATRTDKVSAKFDLLFDSLKTHYLHLKRILNEALKIHDKTVSEYKVFPYRDLTFVEVIFQKRKYHIPLKYLALYDEHPHKNEVLPIVQDYICTVRG